MYKLKFPGMTAALLSVFLVGACTAEKSTSETTGQYFDDAAISTKVRAAIIGDAKLRITDIGVETFKNKVQLSGFVDSAEVKRHAAEVAAGVAGVKAVENNLVVK